MPRVHFCHIADLASQDIFPRSCGVITAFKSRGKSGDE
jgi:hypothetical protein